MYLRKSEKLSGVWPRGAIGINNSWMRVSNSAVVNNECGIYISGAASRLTLTNNLISQNSDGIRAYGDSKAESLYIKFNDLSGNKCAFAMPINFSPPYYVADSNWWGDETGPWDPSNGAPDYNPQGKTIQLGIMLFIDHG